MGFSRHALVLPEATIFEEHSIVSRGDAIVSDYCKIDFGIIADGRVFIGQCAGLKGIRAKDDVRIDVGACIEGDVFSGNNVFLGERAHITGKLSLEGDLDIGDNVKIDGGFEAKGWINIRNPIPMIVYIFIYLLQLLRAGRSDEIEQILKELEMGNESIPVSEIYAYVPRSSIIGLQNSRTAGSFIIGERSKVIGNWNAEGIVRIGAESNFYGSLKAQGSVVVGRGANVFGSIESDGKVTIEDGARVMGDISCRILRMSKNASVDGTIKALLGMSFIDSKTQIMEEKLERFEAGVFEGINSLL